MFLNSWAANPLNLLRSIPECARIALDSSKLEIRIIRVGVRLIVALNVCMAYTGERDNSSSQPKNFGRVV